MVLTQGCCRLVRLNEGLLWKEERPGRSSGLAPVDKASTKGSSGKRSDHYRREHAAEEAEASTKGSSGKRSDSGLAERRLTRFATGLPRDIILLTPLDRQE